MMNDDIGSIQNFSIVCNPKSLKIFDEIIFNQFTYNLLTVTYEPGKIER